MNCAKIGFIHIFDIKIFFFFSLPILQTFFIFLVKHLYKKFICINSIWSDSEPKANGFGRRSEIAPNALVPLMLPEREHFGTRISIDNFLLLSPQRTFSYHTLVILHFLLHKIFHFFVTINTFFLHIK